MNALTSGNSGREGVGDAGLCHTPPPFDMTPVPAATLADLSKLVFEEEYLAAVFAGAGAAQGDGSYEERLAACRMIVSPDDTTPTVAGLLSIGKNPQAHLYGADIQFLRIDGTALADPVIDEEKIGGRLTEMLRRIVDKLNAHNRTAVDITSTPTHQITRLYPMPALRQLLYNAVFHRKYDGSNAPVRVYWYDDRIEIISPGGPYGNVTADNFGKSGITDYRNPNIGNILKNLGYIRYCGGGITIAREALQENGNPAAEFEVNQGFVRCVIRGKV